MEQVSPHVYIDAMEGPCCIGAIQTEEGVLLVDSPQYPTRAERWLEEIKGLGQIKYLLNTEPHADHVFGNAFVPGTIIAHQYIKDVFWDDAPFGPNFMKTPEVFIEMFDPERLDAAGTYQAREPEITFEGKMNLYLGEVAIEAIPLNGHVPNDTAVYIPEERVLFATDNVFNEVMTWYHDSLPYDWLETLDYLKSLDAEIVIPGHGKPGGGRVVRHDETGRGGCDRDGSGGHRDRGQQGGGDGDHHVHRPPAGPGRVRVQGSRPAEDLRGPAVRRGTAPQIFRGVRRQLEKPSPVHFALRLPAPSAKFSRTWGCSSAGRAHDWQS